MLKNEEDTVDKEGKLVFIRSEYIQYQFLLEDKRIREKVETIIFKYISIEALYKRLLIVEKEDKIGRKLSEKEKRNLSVQLSEMKRVLEYFELKYDSEVVERLFGSNDKNYMECSVKKLRDRFVHKINDNVIRALLEREQRINADIDKFMQMVLIN